MRSRIRETNKRAFSAKSRIFSVRVAAAFALGSGAGLLVTLGLAQSLHSGKPTLQTVPGAHLTTITPGSQTGVTSYPNEASPSVSTADAEPPAGSVSAPADSDRFRITSLLGAGLCEGLPAVATSIVPVSIAIGPAGELLFNDGQFNAVRQIANDTTINTLAWVQQHAGISSTGKPLDLTSRFGIPLRLPGLPQLQSIADVALDPNGRALVVDRFARGVFLIQSNLAVPVAGIGGSGDSSGDGGAATSARFHDPQAIGADSGGGIYISDQRADGAFVIRFVNGGCTTRTFYSGTAEAVSISPGNIATIAGGGSDTSDGATAVSASLSLLGRVTTDAQGNLFFSTIDVDPVTFAFTSRVKAINVGSSPVTLNGVTLAPGTVQTLAGGQNQVYADGIPAREAAIDVTFSQPVAVDSSGNFYFAEFDNNDIKRVNAQGTISTYGGNGSASYTPPGLNRTATTTVAPSDVVIDQNGTLYYAGQGEYEIRAIGSDGIVRQVAGNGFYRYCGDGRAATALNPLFEPMAHIDDSGDGPEAVMDGNGNVYFADYGNDVIRRIAPDGTLSTVIGQAAPCAENAGSHSGCPGSYGGDGGPYQEALLNQPYALALDDHGLFISDAGNRAVRYANFSKETVQRLGITIGPGNIETVAGAGQFGASNPGAFCPDDPYSLTGPPPGVPTKAKGACANPYAIALLPNGDLVYTEYFNRSAIWRVDATGNLSLVAGRSAANGYGVVSDPDYGGCNTDGGPATQYALCEPTSLFVDELGNIYAGLQGSSGVIGAELGSTVSERVDYINLGSTAVTVHGVTVQPGYIQRVAGRAKDTSEFLSCVVSSGDAGPALDAGLCSLRGVAAQGDLLFFSDSWNERIRVVDETGTINTFAGNGTPLGLGASSFGPWPFAGGYDGDGGGAGPSRLMIPGQLSIPSPQNGFLLVADNSNQRLRMVIDCNGAGAGTPLCSGTPTPTPIPSPTPQPTPQSLPSCTPVQLVTVASREIHGSAGMFDVDLTNGTGIECRSGGAGGNYILLFRFANPLTNVDGASVISGTGSVASNNIDPADPYSYIVNLTGVTNAQRITVSLNNVADSAAAFSSAVPATMGVLLADVNASGRVDAADVSSVRQQTLQPVTASNFRNDLNASGRIDAADVSIARQQTLTSLP
jgi:hypothetical protein